MYHALVRKDGVWVSFGLHVPSPQWTNIFHTLQRAFGHDNVACTFWKESDTSFKDGVEIAAHAKREVHLANVAQTQWERGQLVEAADEGRLNLARGISLLVAA